MNAADTLVEGGARWLDLLQQTIPQGLTPPTLVDFLELSVGGTLSLGGIGSQSFRHGPQVDNVLELQVVTGEGELVTCSPSQNRQLFDVARAGLGQFGIVVPILIYPYNRDKFTAPLFRIPEGRHVFVFSLLRNAVPPTPERAAGLVADNRALFERTTELGGKRYPFDSVPMTKHDWQKHYQPVWGKVVSAKRSYDPDGILTPGQGIF